MIPIVELLTLLSVVFTESNQYRRDILKHRLLVKMQSLVRSVSGMSRISGALN